MLEGKNILVGVTGSIAIYKTLELIRAYIKAGANVKVLMSEEAKKFITPLCFEAISQNEVLSLESESWSNSNNHIYIGKWADIFVIAPISANSLNKIANGIADNLLTSTVLAYNKKIILAPAANTNMILNPITLESIKKLQALGFIFAHPQEKLLACNDKGIGAMSEPNDIYELTVRELTCKEFWLDKEVIITGGGTIEKIDDVRCLSNFSSGKMANALAKAFYYAGAKVTLITSAQTFFPKENLQIKHFQSTNQLAQLIQEELSQNKKYLFMAAAISDYIPTKQETGKLKKSKLGTTWTLELKQNTDILASLKDANLIKIGFKAEMDSQNALQHAQNMLKDKELDAVCLNILEAENNFGSDKNKVTFLTKQSTKELPLNYKEDIAAQILKLSESL